MVMDYSDLMLCHVVLLNSISRDFVFKGALLLKALGNTVAEPFRTTVDIDFDFTNTNVTQIDLDELIKSSCTYLRGQGYNVYSRKLRDFSDGKSAGYKITDSNGTELYHIDISVRVQNNNMIQYFNNVPIRCATFEKVVCDKMSAVSKPVVNRRIKDVFDLYYLSSICDFNYRSIVDTFKSSNRRLGDFSTFLSSYDNLSHAYSLFRGIFKKKDFSIIYAQVKEFCLPFYKYNLNGKGNAYWSCVERQWAC